MPPPRRARPSPPRFDLPLANAAEAWRDAWAPENQAQTVLFATALALLFVSAIFGGASQGNALSLMAVELASLPLLFVALYLTLAGAAPRAAIAPLILLLCLIAVPLAQLIPLPVSIWTGLPNRGPILQALDLTRQAHISLPFSLAPEQTWRCAMALTPPAAMFLGALFLTAGQRRVMVICWLALAIVSLTIGAGQMLGGPGSPLYFYAITNPDSPVGLFSNRNHQAEFLLCLIPVAAVFAAEFGGSLELRRALGPLLAALYVLLAIAGVAVTRSRAGLALAVIALVGAALVVMRGRALGARWRGAAGVGVVALVAVGAVLMFGLGPILDRFGNGGEPRFTAWPIVQAAAASYMPFGSGVGSFEIIYRSVEPLKDITPIYFNHAHNDFLEVWLETGVVGPLLILAFLAWLAVRSLAIWRGHDAPQQVGEGDLAAASTLMVLLMVAHSAADYPLRTEALAVLFAFACATITAYRPGPASSARSSRSGRRRSTARP